MTEEPIEGKHAVCVGRSHLVGKPVGVMLLNRNATVTYCHSRTKNLTEVTKDADILVAAIGKPEFITVDMVKQGATVIDVGINSVDDRLVGDVKFDEVKEVAGFYYPCARRCWSADTRNAVREYTEVSKQISRFLSSEN